jgi:hypothetical protein
MSNCKKYWNFKIFALMIFGDNMRIAKLHVQGLNDQLSYLLPYLYFFDLHIYKIYIYLNNLSIYIDR